LLVADHAPTRIGVRIALNGLVEVCAEAGDAEQAIRIAELRQPDVCLVSLDIPGGGLEAVRGIRRVAPAASIVVSAEAADVDDLLAAVRAGAVGYLPGGMSADPLRRIIRAVAKDEAALPRAMVIELMRELQTGDGASRDGLTSRESQVLGMLRRGHSTASIAERLEIAPVTVRRHISQLVQKFGVDDRAALVGANGPARGEPSSHAC
jgi:DNA-binding NarL/FixJ family response regulator